MSVFAHIIGNRDMWLLSNLNVANMTEKCIFNLILINLN